MQKYMICICSTYIDICDVYLYMYKKTQFFFGTSKREILFFCKREFWDENTLTGEDEERL